MAELQKTIEQITTRIVDAHQEKVDVEKEANALEEEARAKRRRMAELKTQIAQLDTVLSHSKIAKQVVDHEAASAKARAESESTAAESKVVLERLTAKETELDALIEKAKAQTAE